MKVEEKSKGLSGRKRYMQIPKHSRICAFCRDTFLAKNKDTVYCSKKCKDKAWKETHKEYGRVYFQNWKQTHPEKMQEYKERALSPEKQRRMKEYQAHYWAIHKEEILERRKLNIHKRRAQRIGLRIPLKEKCEVCGKKGNTRHHPDYSKPDFVITLCRSCHTKLHLGTLVLGEIVFGK